MPLPGVGGGFAPPKVPERNDYDKYRHIDVLAGRVAAGFFNSFTAEYVSAQKRFALGDAKQRLQTLEDKENNPLIPGYRLRESVNQLQRILAKRDLDRDENEKLEIYGETLTAQEADIQRMKRGFKPRLYEGPQTEAQVAFDIKRDEERMRQAEIEHEVGGGLGFSAVKFGGSLLGAMADPINVGLALIPGAGQLSAFRYGLKLKTAKKAGGAFKTSERVSRNLLPESVKHSQRAKTFAWGAVEGTATGSAIEFAHYELQDELQEAYLLQDAVLGIGSEAILTGLFSMAGTRTRTNAMYDKIMDDGVSPVKARLQNAMKAQGITREQFNKEILDISSFAKEQREAKSKLAKEIHNIMIEARKDPEARALMDELTELSDSAKREAHIEQDAQVQTAVKTIGRGVMPNRELVAREQKARTDYMQGRISKKQFDEEMISIVDESKRHMDNPNNRIAHESNTVDTTPEARAQFDAQQRVREEALAEEIMTLKARDKIRSLEAKKQLDKTKDKMDAEAKEAEATKEAKGAILKDKVKRAWDKAREKNLKEHEKVVETETALSQENSVAGFHSIANCIKNLKE